MDSIAAPLHPRPRTVAGPPFKKPNSSEKYGVSTRFPPNDLDIEISIDWIEVKVELSQPTQFRHVQARMSRATGTSRRFIEPHADGGAPNACTSFVLKMHDPEGPDDLLAFLQDMVPLGGPPISDEAVTVMGIEVSMDVRSSSHTGDISWINDLLEHLIDYRSYRPEGISRLRCAAPPTCAVRSWIVSTRELLKIALGVNATIHSGDLNGSFKQRLYAKTYDTTGGEAYAALPSDQWSARYEVTLKKDRVPFNSIKQWRAFTFTSLRTEYFTWRLEPAERRQSSIRQLGALPAISRVRGKKIRGRQNLSGTLVDKAFGQAIKNALERMDRRQFGRYKRKGSMQKSEQLCIPEE